MGRFSALQWFGDQWRKLPAVDLYKADLTGQTVIVTGSNVGLGLEAARHLAHMGPGKLILACRTESTGRAAVESIVKETNCPNVECWALDLASFESIKAFAERFEKEGGGKLDLLIENAGIATLKFDKTQDGWERTLQVNHLGTCHLAIRLLPYLFKAPASPPTPRLVVVSSEAHYLTEFEGDDSLKRLEQLNDESRNRNARVMSQRYNISKLLNVFFTRALAARIPSSSTLTVNSVNPGFCRSSLTRESNFINNFMSCLKPLLARTTEMGSRTLVHAALSPELQGVTGEYLNACHVSEPSDVVLGESGKVLEETIWVETIEILSAVDPKVPDIVREYLT